MYQHPQPREEEYVKDPSEMTEEEIREEVVKLLAERKRRGSYWHSSERADAVRRDPKAYFTKRNDFIKKEREAERTGEDTSWIPKLNEVGGKKTE